MFDEISKHFYKQEALILAEIRDDTVKERMFAQRDS
jgi:hypothetical protein